MGILRPLLVALAVALALAGATAQAAQPIGVVASDAVTDFPFSIEFQLTAEGSAAEIVEAELLYGDARSEILSIVPVAVRPGSRVELTHRLDTQVYYYPPGTEMVYRWVLRDALGNSFETPAETFVYHDTRFEWRELSERNVTIYWYRGNQAFGQEMMETALRTLDRLQAQMGAELTQPVRFYIYGDSGDMRSALQSNEVEWVGGQAWTNLGVILAAIEAGDVAEVRRILPHELSHQVLSQATENPYGGVPVWFDEGLAVYNQETADPAFTAMVEAAAEEGRLIPLEALASSFPADPEQARLSYAQSESVIAYLVATYGEAKIGELVAAFREATPLETALQTTLGVGVDELDAAWQATLPESLVAALPTPPSQTAPADRFEDVADPLSGPPQDVPETPAFVSWVEGLPPLSAIGLMAACCIALAALTGVVTLVALRVLGIDKRG